MLSLVYVSAATKEFDARQLQEILDTSRRNNALTEVTGLLIYLGGNILQALEGEVSLVSGLYERIARDPRHRNLIKLHEEAIDQRQFDKWSMALADPAALGPDCEAESLDVIRHGLTRTKGSNLESRVRILLRTFADTMR